MKRVSATIVKETSEKMRNARIELRIQKERLRENVLNPSLAILAPFQQKYLSAGKLKAPVDGSGVDSAGSGLLCCSSLPSDIFIFNWRGGNYTPLHVPGTAPESGRMRLPGLPPPPLSPPGGGGPRCLLALVATTPIPSSILLILQ